MQVYWSTASNVTTLDIDSDVETDDPYAAQKEPVRRGEGHRRARPAAISRLCSRPITQGLVAPFCLSAVRSFFDGL